MYKRPLQAKEYPFRFTSLDADVSEKELQDCFQQIISPSPAKSSKERAEITMRQTCRLFELYHSLDDLFLAEIEEKRKAEKTAR